MKREKNNNKKKEEEKKKKKKKVKKLKCLEFFLKECMASEATRLGL